MAIADSWDAAASALSQALNGENPLPTIALVGSTIGVVALVIFLAKRR